MKKLSILVIISLILANSFSACRKTTVDNKKTDTTAVTSPNDTFPPNRCRIISDSTWHYDYDSLGRLVKIRPEYASAGDSFSYAYFGSNLIVRKQLSHNYTDSIYVNAYGLFDSLKSYDNYGFLYGVSRAFYDNQGYITQLVTGVDTFRFILTNGDPGPGPNWLVCSNLSFRIGDLFNMMELRGENVGGFVYLKATHLSSSFGSPRVPGAGYEDCSYTFDAGGKIKIAKGNWNNYGSIYNIERRVYTYECK